ncbi:hypothetical protein QJS10_CPA05g00975 [Acorus calamus]|uniref:Uncharacterized protein n=1 Tax=Acorus calamus TaxID=4465 RepID=A0AAV9ES31_ACOCL|nr:hypothetical protein QJS10_CPA05g00975 [Acorus calamus]
MRFCLGHLAATGLCLRIGTHVLYGGVDMAMWDEGVRLRSRAGGGVIASVTMSIVLATAWVIWRTCNTLIFRSQPAYAENAWEEIAGGLIKEWGRAVAGVTQVNFQGGVVHAIM